MILCALTDIEDGGTKAFDLGPGRNPRDIFVWRQGKTLRAFANSCPHLEAPLDWHPDRFLTADGSHFICATHGALFRLLDGFCVAGPCTGKSLTAVPVTLDASGQVCLQTP